MTGPDSRAALLEARRGTGRVGPKTVRIRERGGGDCVLKGPVSNRVQRTWLMKVRFQKKGKWRYGMGRGYGDGRLLL